MRTSKLLRDLMRPDKPGDSERRIQARKAGEQAHGEMLSRFGSITAANAADAIKWQENRIQELCGHATA